MKKQLLAIFGPIVIAAALIGLLFLSPFKINAADPELWYASSSSMSANVIRGNTIKNEAIESGKYVPFFGSSELSRISPFHPSVLAKKYQRDYIPFLLGAPGTQSLTQFMMMQSLGKELEGKKIVFVISPQWFVRGGINRAYFDAYFSELQTYRWASKDGEPTIDDRYLADRMLAYQKVTHLDDLEEMLERISRGVRPTDKQLELAQIHINLLEREDELFSRIGLVSKNQQIAEMTKKLPANYDFQELDQMAYQIGQKDTDNNSFEIDNRFYDQRIKARLPKLNNSQKNWDYRYSVEYSDFQLVLDQIAKMKAEALFIIPPINKLWSEYTGLSQNMLDQFSQKITYQLKSQGFDQIADFTNDDDVKYFMTDTIHLGWRGWLAADRYIEPFLSDQTSVVPHYQIKDEFLTKEWQEKDPADLPN